VEWKTAALLGVIAVSAVFRLREGYVRRKPHWSRDSWTRFARALVLVGFPLLLPLMMGIAVDSGLYAKVGASDTFRGLWVTAMILLLIGGVTAGMIVTSWFAKGDPSKPCPPGLRSMSWLEP
jgi:hypothetical protein